VADSGFDGLVLRIALRGIERWVVNGYKAFRVAAGEDWDQFVAHAVEDNCAGIECLSGIPGTVGGTPVQNVGAYGQEVSETIHEVSAFDRHSLTPATFSGAECGFVYRASRFNSADRDRYIILNVTYRLRHGGQPKLHYTDLERAFAGGPAKPSLSQVRDAVRHIRRNKAMLLVDGDENAHSAGSFFKNPVVTQRAFEELAARMESRGLAMPSYPAGDGLRKLPAAWLLEQAGFVKGYTRGAAAISTRHTLAIVNRGGATAAEIVALKDEIQAKVHGEFGIELIPEPVFVGF
jgi:UDP-N-acetylmuramate dehydrogenase